MNNVGRVEPE